jgi:hypothetical protein
MGGIKRICALVLFAAAVFCTLSGFARRLRFFINIKIMLKQEKKSACKIKKNIV